MIISASEDSDDDSKRLGVRVVPTEWTTIHDEGERGVRKQTKQVYVIAGNSKMRTGENLMLICACAYIYTKAMFCSKKRRRNHLIIIGHTLPSPRQVAGIVFGVAVAAAAADIATVADTADTAVVVAVAGTGLRYWENMAAARRCILVRV